MLKENVNKTNKSYRPLPVTITWARWWATCRHLKTSRIREILRVESTFRTTDASNLATSTSTMQTLPVLTKTSCSQDNVTSSREQRSKCNRTFTRKKVQWKCMEWTRTAKTCLNEKIRIIRNIKDTDQLTIRHQIDSLTWKALNQGSMLRGIKTVLRRSEGDTRPREPKKISNNGRLGFHQRT